MPAISGPRVGKTTYGHGILSSIVPVTVEVSNGWVSLMSTLENARRWKCARGMIAEDIGIILAEVAAGRGGPPCRMRSDNGPDFVAQVVQSWLEETGSGTLYVRRGAPGRTVIAESFQSKVCDEFLNREEFESEPQARALALGRRSIIPNARTVP